MTEDIFGVVEEIKPPPPYRPEPQDFYFVAAYYDAQGTRWWKLFPDQWTSRVAAEQKAGELGPRWTIRKIVKMTL